MSEEKKAQEAENEENTQQSEVDGEKELTQDEFMSQQVAQQSFEGEKGEDANLELTSNGEQSSQNMDILLDIPLEITVEIGSTQMLIEEVLKLNPNSIVELERYIDEPIDLKVNGKIIAKGELYSVQNSFGIKITHIITPEDRLKLIIKD